MLGPETNKPKEEITLIFSLAAIFTYLQRSFLQANYQRQS
jgi:hypothetical protein